jgi:hypothetical protein
MSPIRLDPATADRMLAGSMPLDDVPPGFVAVAQLLETVRAGVGQASARDAATVAAMESAALGQFAPPTRLAGRVGQFLSKALTMKGAAVASVILLGAGMSAAVIGTLSSSPPVGIVHTLAKRVSPSPAITRQSGPPDVEFPNGICATQVANAGAVDNAAVGSGQCGTSPDSTRGATKDAEAILASCSAQAPAVGPADQPSSAVPSADCPSTTATEPSTGTGPGGTSPAEEPRPTPATGSAPAPSPNRGAPTGRGTGSAGTGSAPGPSGIPNTSGPGPSAGSTHGLCTAQAASAGHPNRTNSVVPVATCPSPITAVTGAGVPASGGANTAGAGPSSLHV